MIFLRLLFICACDETEDSKNALRGLPGLDAESLALLFSRTGIDPSLRAETLSLEDYAALAREYARLRG